MSKQPLTCQRYFDYYNEYKTQYPKIAVLMQVGKFYEIYQYEQLGNAIQIANDLGIQIKLKNKDKPYSELNPYWGGFPVISYEEKHQQLLDHGYAIIRINETGKKIKIGSKTEEERKLTEILTPGTNINNKSQEYNYLVSLYFKSYKLGSLNKWAVGISGLDVSTGDCWLDESIDDEFRDEAVLDIRRYLTSIKYSEVIIYHDETFRTAIEELLNFSDRIMVHWRTISPETSKIGYQHEFYKKLYKNEHLDDFDSLSEFTYGLTAFISLIQFCYQQNQDLVKCVNRVKIRNINNQLILTDNCLTQLDVISNGSSLNLLKVIDYTSTRMGKRLLKSRLSNPITNQDTLAERYKNIQYLIDHSDILRDAIVSLCTFPDLERLQHQLRIGKISPKSLVSLFNSYEVCCKLLGLGLVQSVGLIEAIKDSINRFYEYFDVEILSGCKYYNGRVVLLDVGNPIKNCVGEHQALLSERELLLKQLQDELDRINKECNLKQSLVYRLEVPQKEDPDEDGNETTIFIGCTKGAMTSINKQFKGKYRLEGKGRRSYINSDSLTAICEKFTVLQAKIESFLTNSYLEFVLRESQYKVHEEVYQVVSEYDFLCSGARCAIDRKYFKPEIVENHERACLKIEGVRHPIIEAMGIREYIPNDIQLGYDNYGMLIYGTNGCGKSALIKAVGLSVILAQMGYFVPGRMTYSPYRRIITRLSGMDDMFSHKSYFQVEMSEIKIGLEYADPWVLVIGDEICKGTDVVGATSLSAATLLYLDSREASYMISSHYHHLADLDKIKRLRLNICHLETRKENGLLIYDRKLKQGKGSTSYGIDVAEFMGLPEEYIENARAIRAELIGKNLFASNN